MQRHTMQPYDWESSMLRALLSVFSWLYSVLESQMLGWSNPTVFQSFLCGHCRVVVALHMAWHHKVGGLSKAKEANSHQPLLTSSFWACHGIYASRSWSSFPFFVMPIPVIQLLKGVTKSPSQSQSSFRPCNKEHTLSIRCFNVQRDRERDNVVFYSVELPRTILNINVAPPASLTSSYEDFESKHYLWCISFHGVEMVSGCLLPSVLTEPEPVGPTWWWELIALPNLLLRF